MRKKPIVALIYDFDGTLSPGNMQEFGFIQAIGKSPDEFWRMSDEIAKGQDASNILSYMKLMFDEARRRDIKLRREDFQFVLSVKSTILCIRYGITIPANILPNIDPVGISFFSQQLAAISKTPEIISNINIFIIFFIYPYFSHQFFPIGTFTCPIATHMPSLIK